MKSTPFSKYPTELKRTLLLAAPIAAGHVGQMILGFVDTLMIGRVGVVPLAASAFANVLIHFVFIIGVGLLSSVAVLVSHAHGAGNRPEAGEVLRRGLLIAFSAGCLMFWLLWAGMPLLPYMGQPPAVIKACQGYLLLVGMSMPYMMGIICFRNFSEAQDAPWPAFWAGFAGVALNVFLNWILIYGNWGFPALGLEGAGIATLLSRIFSLGLLILWLRSDKRFHRCWPARWLARLPLKSLIIMTKLGFPVALQLAMEVGAFGATALLMGWLGIVELAAHQIAITCAATTFMIPLGISLAVAIRVGQALGAGQLERPRVIVFGAFAFALCTALLFAFVFIVFSRELASIFTPDPLTVAIAAGLLVVAGLFQVFDGSQVIFVGALRGCKDVNRPTWIIFTSYWIIGLPVGALLAFPLGSGATGLWYGLSIALAFASLGLMARFLYVTRKLTSCQTYPRPS
jgi:MATE family multidrug resistance protein